MAGFRPELQTCPCCGGKGSCRIHAYYDRSLVDFMGGAPVRHSLCIMRLICTCGHTHAILPDFIIPYSGYGLFFILRVLAEYFLHLSTMEKLCERFSITLSQCTTTFLDSQTQKWLSTSSTRLPVPEGRPPSSTRQRFPPSTATPRGAPAWWTT